MNQKAQQLYDRMQTDLALCRKKGLGFRKELECCFQIADRYWAILKQELISYAFPSKEEEIRFFKKIKPLFTSEVEYCRLCYHAELFLADTTVDDQIKFLERETQRLHRFIQDNPEFHDCYRKECTAHDERWYRRDEGEGPIGEHYLRYDREEWATTSHDPLVAALLALERYHGFAVSRLAALQRTKSV